MSKLNLRSYPPSLKKNAWSQVRVNYSFSTCFEFSFPTILIPWSKHGLGRGRGWCRWMWVKMWVVGVEWNLLPDSWENRRPCTRLSEVFEVRLRTFPSLLRSKISIFFGDGANSCLLGHSRGEYVDSRLGSIRSFHVSIVCEPGVLKSSRLF